MEQTRLDGALYKQLICAGAANLQRHEEEINDLNVFPIPDGDTGSNMLMTIMGGVREVDTQDLGEVAKEVANGMLLSARGNSGVILSQFFDGIAVGFSGVESAETEDIFTAFDKGVKSAYEAVEVPTEGTILTVMKEATEYACQKKATTPIQFIQNFLAEARRSLERTPELLKVLKEAGVVDSGGAGLVYIVEGMEKALSGESLDLETATQTAGSEPDYNLFTADDELTFGYCTEVLLRLQRKKTEIAEFSTQTFSSALSTLGDSVVCVQNDTIVKIHVHTKTPSTVLEFCQRYGEFLKVKIENMSLQHNGVVEKKGEEKSAPQKEYGVIAVAMGEGIKEAFLGVGADVVIDGGQTCNPATEEFLTAFEQVNAKTIFVFPNNSNVILTAKQASKLYEKANVIVMESKDVGQGYAGLSMLDTTLPTVEEMVEIMSAQMQATKTAEVSQAIKDSTMSAFTIQTGDYMGFSGKEILAVEKDKISAVYQTLNGMKIGEYAVCIVVVGEDGTQEEQEKIESYMQKHYPETELYFIEGKQKVYSYILIGE